MQVNSIQSSTPNFGMALKIKKNAVEALAKKTTQELEQIKKVGEELKGHKYVDVVLGKGAKPVVKTPYANDYCECFHPEVPRDEFLRVKTFWAGTESGDLKKGSEYVAQYSLGSKEAAQKAYEEISSAPSSIEKAAEFAKVIEENTALKVAKAAEEKAKLDAQKAMADDLFSQFGADDFKGWDAV